MIGVVAKRGGWGPAPIRAAFGNGSIRAGASATLAVNLVGTVLSYAATVLLARLLDPAGFGIYSFVFSLALLLVLPAQLGIPTIIIREVAAAGRGGGWGRVRGLIAWSRRFVLVGTAIIAAVGGAVFWAVPASRGGADLGALLLGLALVPILGAVGVESAVLRGSFRVALAQVPDRVLRQVLQIGLLLGMWVAVGRVGPTGALLATVLGGFGALLFAGWAAHRWRDPASRGADAIHAGREWLASALPIGLSSGLAVVSAAAGPVILGYVAPAAEAGSFRIASQFALLGGLAYTTLVSVLSPRFAAAKGDGQTINRINQTAARAATLAAAVCLVGFAILGRWLLAKLFGAGYMGAWWPTLILLAGACTNAAFGFAAAILTMNGEEGIVSRCFFMSTTLMLGVSVPAGAWFGATGVAAASAAGTLMTNLILTSEARRRLEVRTGLGARTR